MDRKTYDRIYRELNTVADMDRLAKRYRSLDRELFLVIYTQKLSRSVIQNYHRIKKRSPRLALEWKNGKSLMDISKEIDFPPVMTAYLIMNHNGIGKKTFRKMVNEPESIEDPRLRKEISVVRNNDRIYSPEGNLVQKKRGIWGEERMKVWLDQRKVRYKREEDLRGEGQKTPDFLLDKAIYFRGEQVNWIESKASFGDEKEVRKNVSKQLVHYRDLFGSGMVIYWYGILDDLPVMDGIIIETEEVLQDRWDID